MDAATLRRNLKFGTTALILFLALFHVLISDRTRPQGFDEPAHIAAGMECLQFHSYRIDPLHPPFSRIAMAAPLYLRGERFQEHDSHHLPELWDAGNSILYQHSRYLQNLFLARIGVLPFSVVLLTVVFVWSRRLYGEFAALVSLILLASLPLILSFSSLAYTDLPAACMQVTCLFMFALWLERPDFLRSTLLATLFALAVLTKFTTLLYLPLSALAMLGARTLSRNRDTARDTTREQLFAKMVAMFFVAILVTWAGYWFSIGHIDDTAGLSPSNIPSFQHFPRPVAQLAKDAVRADWKVPAPELIEGLSEAWVLNKSAPPAYLFGKTKQGGWWYFFLAEIVFKTPLPFLLLAVLGFLRVGHHFFQQQWERAAPALVALVILLITTQVSTNYGLRHVLIVFPLLAMVAGHGSQWLWNCTAKFAPAARVLALCLIAWQCATTLQPRSDSLSYFNALAGTDPSAILVSGCDFDCGQDLLLLAADLHRRQITEFGLAVWSSADVSQMGLPPFHLVDPTHPQSGWIAISARAMREGSVLHTSHPAGAFSWLKAYKPVAKVGSTITLYYIAPPQNADASATPKPLPKG